MELLTTVEYNGATIRVYGKKHSPMFSAEDISSVLKYNTVNDALRLVDLDDKSELLINEYGLFTLISAKCDVNFKHFVTREMLPQLHKHGKVKKEKTPKTKKKYERLYELGNGEKINKTELVYRAITFGMPKTEAKRECVAALVGYINSKNAQIAEKEFIKNVKPSYPYTYDDVDELCSGNLSILWRLLPENSYIRYNEQTYLNEQAVAIVREEIAKWK